MDKSTYLNRRMAALASGDKGFCVPMAISLVTDNSFDAVNNLLIGKGLRRKGQGVNRDAYTSLLNDGTFGDFEVVDVTDEVRARGGKTVRSVAKVCKRGRFLVSVRGHLLAVINGEVCDWSDGRLHRVQRVLEVKARVSAPVTPAPHVAPRATVVRAPHTIPARKPTPVGSNVVLMDMLVNGKGFQIMELKTSGKFLRWDTMQGTVLLSGGVKNRKVRLFIRNPETVEAMRGILDIIADEPGKDNAKDTAWFLTVNQLVQVRDALWG